jgi:hypothetical protein
MMIAGDNIGKGTVARWGSTVNVASGLIAAIALALLGAGTASAMTSTGWAGYQARHDTFRYVSASWTIPTLAGCSGASGGASWSLVGLGISQWNIVGIHVIDDCAEQFTGDFANSYIFSQGLTEIQLPVNEGDRVTAAVSYHASYYYLSFVDHTNSHSSWYQRYRCGNAYGIPCSRGAADVFHGKSSPGTAANPMADWGRLTFDHIALADNSGRRGSFARSRFWRIAKFNLYDPATDFALGPQAVASPLSQQGTRFTDIWRHYDQ